MKLEHQISKLIWEHPQLYWRFNEPDISRLLVLANLFLSVGTGFVWYDGYLAECPKTRSKKGLLPYGEKTFRKLPKDFFTQKLWSVRWFFHNSDWKDIKQILETQCTKGSGIAYYILRRPRSFQIMLRTSDEALIIRIVKTLGGFQDSLLYADCLVYDYCNTQMILTAYKTYILSAIMRIPKDIRPDWLGGAQEVREHMRLDLRLQGE